MLRLRREYRDGAEPPEIVLLHAEVTLQGGPAGPREDVPGSSFPRMCPAAGWRIFPSRARGGGADHHPLPVLLRSRREERVSPPYEIAVPSDEAIADLYRIPEEGRGTFRPRRGAVTSS